MRWHGLMAAILLPLAFLFLQCSDDGDRTITVEMDQPFNLDFYQSANVLGEDLRVTFAGAAADVRSDQSEGYVYPGYAEALIKVKAANLPEETIQVGIVGNSSEYDCARLRMKWRDYYFELRSLYPDPNVQPLMKITTPPMPPTRISLMVTRSGPPDSLTGTVILTDYVAGLPHDPYTLDNAAITADTLIIDVSYGGGCKRHYFFLYMAPKAFLESSPVQANLYLRHYDNYDECKEDTNCVDQNCIVHVRLRFDLKPIRELHDDVYGTGGPITLNLFEYFDQEPGDKLVLSYGP